MNQDISERTSSQAYRQLPQRIVRRVKRHLNGWLRIVFLLTFMGMMVSAKAAILLGDLDGDGRVTVLDLVILNNYLNGKVSLTSSQTLAADLNQDGLVTQSDADLLANVILGQSPQAAGKQPWVILAADGTGDFGPQTPGTLTAGWQEALNYCVASNRDLYVKGGYKGPVFNVSTTIYFPPAQDFRIDGGVYVVNYVGPSNTDCMVIDSSMNCDYTLGIIVYGGTQAGLRIKPTHNVPIDGFPIFVESVLRSQGIADPAPFTPGPRGPGTGLVLDGSAAPITYSKIYFAAVLNFNLCVDSSSGTIYDNDIVIEHLHSNATSGTLMTVGAGSRENSYRFGIAVDQGATNLSGLLVSGSRNQFQVAAVSTGFAANQELVLQPSAEGNQINLATDQDPLALITDQANLPDNQVTVTGPPAPISNVTGNAGSYTYTQRLYPAVVTVTAGTSLSISFRRSGSSPINYGSALNHDFTLSVGDSLVISSASSPTLRVIPTKTK